MRFNKHLKKVADEFREKYLKSADKKDKTVLPSDWLNEKVLICKIISKLISIH